MDGGRIPQTIWPHSEVGHNQHAKQELLSRVEFGSSESVFDTPKPTQLIQRMLTLATSTEGGDIVLDFFAGSGSTADAVLQKNAEDDGNRRFIAVQLPEPTGFDDFEFVSDITRARIAAAMDDVESPTLRSFKLAPSNFHDSSTSEETNGLFDLRETTLSTGEEDFDAIAAEILLKEGVPLDASWERTEAAGAPVISADGVAIVLSLDIADDIVEAALELEPRVVVFLEDGFAGADDVKTNAVATARDREITLKLF
jgi:adenine-specific DNA-methyltransferase